MTQIVLLTGSRGFTGRYVRVALEQQGFTVMGLVQSDAQANEVAANLSDAASVHAAVAQVMPHYVVHLAAVAYVTHANAEDFYRVNVLGTLNLLDALVAAQAPVVKVLLASSANVYGNPTVAQVAEDVPPAPVNHYAMSKLGMEHMARTYADRLPIVMTRPFNYTGIGQDGGFLIPKIVAHFKQRAPVISLGNLDVMREFNDVRMVAQAYCGLMRHAPAGALVNLCSGRGYLLSDVLALCAQLTGHELTVEVNPALVRANELKVLIGDAGALNRMLPDLPPYSLKETLQWMLGEGKLAP
jgi:nucleoside-diphosphate-sugar epimerase